MSPSPVQSVVQQLAADIQSGKLPPGHLLPTHRRLAAKYGLAVASASKVYARLKSMGLVVGEIGRGTFVRDRPLDREWDSGDERRLSGSAVDLSFNHPTWEGQADMLRAMLRELATSGDLAAMLRQQPPGGRRYERKIVADFLASERDIEVAPERLWFMNGAQQGLDIVLRGLLSSNDAVAADSLTYPGFKMAAGVLGLVVHAIPGNANGPDLDALEALCRRKPVRAIYTMPTLHNPLAWVLTVQQRRRLVEIARRHNCILIEDAAYAFLENSAPLPLVTIAPERTFYISSLSKSLASGLRFGFVVAPEAYTGQIKAVVRASHWSLPSLITTMAARWLSSGMVAQHEYRMRNDAQKRQAIAQEVLAGMDLVAHPNSLFLWLNLPEGLRADRIAMALAGEGIAVSKAEAYSIGRRTPHALRLGLSSMPMEELSPVLRRLRHLIEHFPI